MIDTRRRKYLSTIHNLQVYTLTLSLVIDIKMTSRELLSAHKTIATFDGISHQKCFHRTALCPDQCGHGGTIATFSIKKVLFKINH